MYKRQELREVNQENMNKVDERIELAKEVFNRKINDNKRAIIKKLEQETIIVNQQIREVDERCRQTESEVQEVREEINTEITQIKEHQKTKWEESRKETQEEMSKVRKSRNRSSYNLSNDIL